jgi:hypothetical protein
LGAIAASSIYPNFLNALTMKLWPCARSFVFLIPVMTRVVDGRSRSRQQVKAEDGRADVYELGPLERGDHPQHDGDDHPVEYVLKVLVHGVLARALVLPLEPVVRLAEAAGLDAARVPAPVPRQAVEAGVRRVAKNR